jgi:hypothetical protein
LYSTGKHATYKGQTHDDQLRIFGGAVLTYGVAGANTSTELQATDSEFVLVPGVDCTIAYVLRTNDRVGV